MSDPYAAGVDEYLGQQEQRLRTSLQLATGADPKTAGEASRLARTTGLPPDTVERNLPDVRRRAIQQSLDAMRLRVESPVLARQLEDPTFARMAYDEAASLGGIERWWAGASSQLSASARSGGYALGSAGLRVANELLAIPGFTTTADEAAVLWKDDPAELRQQLAENPGLALERWATGLAQRGDAAARDVNPLAQARYGGLRYATTDPDQSALSSPVRVVSDLLGTLPTTVALAGTVYFTRGRGIQAYEQAIARGATPAVAAKEAAAVAARTAAVTGAVSEGAISAAQGYDEAFQKAMEADLAASPEYQQLLADGFAPDAARLKLAADTAELAGSIAGTMNAVVNAVGGRYLGRIISEGGSLTTRTLRGAGNEAMTEFAQSMAEQFGQNWAERLNIDPSQPLMENLLEAGVQGAVLGGLLGGGLAAAAGQQRQDSAEAEQVKGQLQTGMDAVRDVLLRTERDPVAFRQLMQTMAQETGGPQEVFVDGEVLAELPEEVLATLSQEVRDQVGEAVATGGAVGVPIAEVLTVAPDTPLEQVILENARIMKPDGTMTLSPAEAKAAAEVLNQEAQGRIDGALQLSADQEQAAAEVEQVRSTIQQELAATGRYRPAVNEGMAQWLTAFYTTYATRAGMTPLQMFERYRVRVAGQATTSTPSMEQPQPQTDTPEFKAWFGDSKVVTPWGTPRVVYRGRRPGSGNVLQGAVPYFSLTDSGARTYAEEYQDGIEEDEDGNDITPDPNDSVLAAYVSIQNVADEAAVTRVAAEAGIELMDPELPSAYLDANPELVEALKAAGYDGVEGRDIDMEGNLIDIVAPFSSAQVKSATGNDGTFDANDPNILSQSVRQGRIRRTVDELVAAAESQSTWRDWYQRHEDTLIQLFGNDADLFQKMLSATSQATGVKGNVSLALKAYEQFLDGRPFEGYLPAVIKNLDRIRADEELRGAKISQYGKANEGDTDAIAVDRHIAMLFFNTKTPSRAQIASAKQRIRKIADRLGWEPRQVQAALWAFNQVRLGTDPSKVESYDKILENRADFIADLRARFGRGEGGSVQAGGDAAAGGEAAGADALAQDSYHGSPHSFSRFDLSHMGTGEGAQMYGWGIYFADEADVAKSYAPRDFDQEEGMQREYSRAEARGDYVLMEVWESAMLHNTAKELAAQYVESGDYGPEYKKAVDTVTRWLKKNPNAVGKFYGVDIPDDAVARMLLWDKPLSEQPEAVQSVVREFAAREGDPGNLQRYWNPRNPNGGPLGSEVYHAISEALGSDAAASELLADAGIPGLRFLDGNSRDSGQGTMNTVVWDQATLDRISDSMEVLAQRTRGTFNPQTLELVLTPDADLSTWFHETGHFFLEVLADISGEPGAPAQIADDWTKVLGWFGVTDEQWRGMSLDQKRPYHERWAESVEQYVMEGKVPNAELQPLMRRFRTWMVSVYKSIRAFLAKQGRQLDEQGREVPGQPMSLNDSIREVMDRMLATDEQIAFAEQAAGMVPSEAATAAAVERLQKRSMADLKWTVRYRDKVIKALQKGADLIRENIRAEVAAEVAQQPIYLADQFLRTGALPEQDRTKAERRQLEEIAGRKTKLDLDALREMYGEAPAAPWRYLPTGKGGLAGKDGLHPDMVADIFGFESGDKLVRELLAAEPVDTVIDALTEKRMLEEHGDLTDEQAIREAANEAVHNEARARSLASELRSQMEALNAREDTGRTSTSTRNGQPVVRKITTSVLAEAAKQFGARVSGTATLPDIRKLISKHTADERRAAQRWEAATRAGKTAEAIKAKQDQMLHNAAVRALTEAASEVKATLTFFRDKVARGSSETDVEKGRDPDVVNAARAVLAAYGIETPATKRADEYMRIVAQHDPRTAADLNDVVVAAMANAQPLAGLTVDDLRALNETIQSLWFISRKMRQAEVAGRTVELDTVAEELELRMLAIGDPPAPGRTGALTEREQAVRKLQTARSWLRRVEAWTEAMDGGPQGVFWNAIFRPVKAAADKYRAQRLDYRKRFAALVDRVAPFMPRQTIDAPELFDPDTGRPYVFGRGHNGIGMSELLHALLHTGNPSNKRKLLLGRGWAEELEDGTLDTRRWDAFIARLHNMGVLQKEHWDFVQGVWDLLEDTKAGAQETHREVFGRYFDEVTAEPVDTPFGTLRGGYVPAQADPLLVQDADLRELLETENAGMAHAFPATSRGFTKSRTEYNRPLKLDLRTLPQHLDKVLLFTNMEPAVRGVERLLRHQSVGPRLGRLDPTAIGSMLKPWLNRSARQQVETPIAGDGGLSRLASTIRGRAGMSAMMANVSNTIQQITGLSLALVKVPRGHLMRAVAEGIANPRKMRDAVWAASPYMQDRGTNEIAVLADTMESILINDSLYQNAKAWTARNAYFMQTAFDNVLSPMVWTGAYNDAVERGLSTDDAVAHADSTVRQTQGSTLPEDVSRVETGNAWARLFTQFIGYFNMQANLGGTALVQIAREVGLRKGAGRALGVVFAGLLAPMWVAEAIAQAFRGGPDDADDDGWLDDWLAAVFGFGTIRGTLAMVPFLGQFGNAAFGRFTGNPTDDRVSLSPAVSMLEGAVGAPASTYKAIVEGGNNRAAVRDVATLVSLATGLPAAPLARPVGYLAGVANDEIVPTGPADAARGVVTGAASAASRQ